MLASVRFGAALMAALAALMVLLSFGGTVHPAFDSLAHFRVHLSLLALGSGAVAMLLGQRTRLFGTAALAAGVIGAWSTAPYASTALGAPPAPTSHADFTILQMNLLYGSDPEGARRTIMKTNPDVVTMQEVTRDHWQVLGALPSYPYAEMCDPGGGRSAVAILSRHPFIDRGDRCIAYEGFLAKEVSWNDQSLTIASQHLSWPWPFNQAAQIDHVAPFVQDLSGPALLAGDFNAAPWSNAVRRYAQAANMTPVHGVGASFPARLIDGPIGRLLGLSIDHVLVSPGLDVVFVSALEPTHSDHLPILVGVRLSETP